nr:MAG TPA: hypothetical protein [Caudoviricetes sp.]
MLEQLLLVLNSMRLLLSIFVWGSHSVTPLILSVCLLTTPSDIR